MHDLLYSYCSDYYAQGKKSLMHNVLNELVRNWKKIGKSIEKAMSLKQ